MVDNLDPIYKNIGSPEAKNKWIEILKKNPTTAINAYHDALCNDQKENGYCDLLKLFRILGALEILKNQKDNPNQLKTEFKELKETVINALPEGQEQVVREHALLTEENIGTVFIDTDSKNVFIIVADSNGNPVKQELYSG